MENREGYGTRCIELGEVFRYAIRRRTPCPHPLSFSVLAFLLVLALATSCTAGDVEKQIPADSLAKLQYMFGRVTDILWDKSDDMFHEGYFDYAAATLRLITVMDPTDTEAFSTGAWLMDSRNRPEEALAFLQHGLSVNPTRYNMYDELGTYHYMKKEYKLASSYLEMAVAFDDCPVLVWRMLAHAYERSGEAEKSIKVWEHLSQVTPDDPVIKLNLDRLKKKRNEDNSTGASPSKNGQDEDKTPAEVDNR